MNRFVQCGLHRRLMTTLLWCLPLAAAAAPAAKPGPPSLPAVGVHIAPVDVVANVRRMLERTQQQQSSANTPATGPKPSIPPAATAGQPTPSAPLPAPRPATAPVAAAKPAAPASGPPVELPDKVITIRSIKDLRGLADELEKAKQRQRQGAQP